MPLPVPPPILDVQLSLPQCRAAMRAIAYAVKVDAAEADHTALVSALGAISRAVGDWEEQEAKRG